jgi:hypothetical protein
MKAAGYPTSQTLGLWKIDSVHTGLKAGTRLVFVPEKTKWNTVPRLPKSTVDFVAGSNHHKNDI